MEKKKRMATFTVKVPIQFTFAGDNELDCEDEEFFKVATTELYKRLHNGYFDVLENELERTKKVTHYTREEIRERNRQWDEIFMGVIIR